MSTPSLRANEVMYPDGTNAGGHVYDVKAPEYGAKGDGTTDDTAAIQAAVTAAIVKGGDVYLPPGYYKVTSTINVGLPEWDSYDFIVTRTAEMTDAISNPHAIGANVTANASKPAVVVHFAEGAYLVASWTPSVATPVLAYNLRSTAQKVGGIIAPSVIGTASFSGGKYVSPPAGPIATNKFIGVYAAAGAKVIEKPFISSIQYGIVSMDGFWTRISNAYAEWCGDALNVAQGNAITVSNIVAWSSSRGLVFDGSASDVRGIHMEGVGQELTIFAADSSTFGPGYIEDTSGTTAAGTYAVTLGYVNNGTKVTHCTFNNLRIASARPSKKAIRIWDTVGSAFVGVRAYSLGVDFDTNSNGAILSGDFDILTNGNWLSTGNDGNISTHEGAGLQLLNTAAAIKWLMYSPAGTSSYLRDAVNARMHVTYTPAATSGLATTSFLSKVVADAAIIGKRNVVTYSASMSLDASNGNEFVITATNSTAFSITEIGDGAQGQRITVRIRNTSGGALGAVTWNTIFKMATWTQPANGFSRSIDFQWDGTNWIEVNRTTSDVPN